jgi:glycosyltransferase involved in cell wall biosynthesis
MNKAKKMKILLLWAPIADYTLACFRELAERKNIELYLVRQPAESDAPYNQPDLSFFRESLIYRKENEKEIEEFCLSLEPDTIMMSSWNYPFYMSVARKCRRKGSYVISSFDGQWRSTVKQKIGTLISPYFLRPAIDNFFVPGDRQAIFARKLGYKNPLLGYYSARTGRFGNISRKTSSLKFIFVGRLVPVKGIEQLIEAYKGYRRTTHRPWELVIAGTGRLKHLCQDVQGIEVKEFVQPADLPQLLSEATCLVLPSTFEPWGVVIHEAVISGLPVICSHACGASTMFVRDGQNGYIINPDAASLTNAMKRISAKTNEELEQMSLASRTLGSLWTTEKWADYVYENICLPVKQLQEL